MLAPMRRSFLVGALAGLAVAALGLDARAFTYIVTPEDTLASIAERYYGRIQYEQLLVAANQLDAHGGTSIVAGARLEVPALGHRRTKQGETWATLAKDLLGAESRADVLAAANGTSPWLPPADGAEIAIPYNLRVVAAGTDTIVTIAYKYMGDMNKAWVLDHYNGLKGRRLARGDVVLVPLTDLPLTEAGKRAAAEAAGASCSQAAGDTRQAQRRVEGELPALMADVRSGRYVDAVARGTRFLSSGSLTQPQLALINRQLLEAYAALDAQGLATSACTEWRKNDPRARVDPVMMSPKLVLACERGSSP